MNNSKRREDETIGDWLIRVSIEDSGWLEKAKWRQENKYWLNQSFRMAIVILRTIREKNISKKQLEDLCGFKLGRTLNGDEDLTLSQICKIQEVLEIKLIDVKINKKKPKFIWLSKLMSYICKK